MKRNRIYQLIGAVAIATLLAGCRVKDPIYNTPHPDHGTVTLTADWSSIGEGLTAPASYTVKAADYTVTVSGVTNRLDRLFVPGRYSIYAYNTAEHITVTGTTANVEAASAPARQTGTFVRNTPGWLFASATDATIEADTEHAYTAVMQQQVRQFTIVIEPAGGTTDRIAGITGTLSGVAASLDIADGTHAAPSSVVLTFSKSPTAQTSANTRQLSGCWARRARSNSLRPPSLLRTAAPQRSPSRATSPRSLPPSTPTSVRPSRWAEPSWKRPRAQDSLRQLPIGLLSTVVS